MPGSGRAPRSVLSQVCLVASREELPPSGFTPAPSASAAGCVFDTMSQMPAMYGGLTHDPIGHGPLSAPPRKY